MNTFEKWDKEFLDQNLYAFNNNPTALLWLKVRAICRARQIKRFCKAYDITLSTSKVADRNIELFDILLHREDSVSMLDRFLQEVNHEWYTESRRDAFWCRKQDLPHSCGF